MKSPLVLSAMCLASLCISCCATDSRTSLFSIQNIQTYKVYESQEKPGHNQWPVAFQDASGNICVIFQHLQGDLKQVPSYDYRKTPEKYGISLMCMRWNPAAKNFEKIWERSLKAPNAFCIIAPTPTPSGKVIGVCSAGGFLPEYAGRNNVVAVLETADQGQSFRTRALLSIPEGEFVPNDIRCIGDKIYLAAYDGKGGAYIAVSDDEGCTWSRPFRFIAAHDNMSFHEPTIAPSAQGGLLVVMRTHRMDIPRHNGINYHMLALSPKPDGTWQTSELKDTGFGFRGKPYLHRAKDGMLILSCPGHFLAFSRNDGRTWETGIYDLKIPKVTIIDQNGTKPFNHNADTMLLELPDGTFYYSYFIGSDFPFPPPCDEYIGGTFFRIERN